MKSTALITWLDNPSHQRRLPGVLRLSQVVHRMMFTTMVYSSIGRRFLQRYHGFDLSRALLEMTTPWPNHIAAANGLSVVRSRGGQFLGRRVRLIGGNEAVADLNR
jgi:hypothetical protein